MTDESSRADWAKIVHECLSTYGDVTISLSAEAHVLVRRDVGETEMIFDLNIAPEEACLQMQTALGV